MTLHVLLLFFTVMVWGCSEDGSLGTGKLPFGARCSQTEDCSSGLCVQVDATGGVCTRVCDADTDCPTAPNWGCVKPAEIETSICGCVAMDALEVCGDGLDNECNGKTDDCRICDGELVAQNDPAHCGECGNGCAPEQSCLDGACVCPPNLPVLCGSDCADIQIDPMHCGGCGVACAEEQSCVNGSCECPLDASTLCGQSCVDLATDASHCGSCDHVCRDGEACIDGTCACPDAAYPDYCDGIGCVDLGTDAAHCGSCDIACGAGLVCTNGACECDGADETLCGDVCVVTSTNPEHCGGCNQPCPAGQFCSQGSCDCVSAGATPCGSECVDITTDLNHCGSCSTACAPGELCDGIGCVCPSGMHCNAACVPIDDNQNCGACGNACPAGQHCSSGACVCDSVALTACGTACVDVQEDGTNCGGCGNVCPAAQFCSAGSCVCPAGETYCSGANDCVNLSNDRLHCGSCTNACAENQECVGSTCQDIVCAPSQTFCSGVELRLCDATGTTATTVDVCSGTRHCSDTPAPAACAADVCLDGQPVCNGTIATVCASDGSLFEPGGTDCSALGEACDQGSCLPIVCTPGEEACVNGDAHHCNALGTSLTIDPCASEEFCEILNGISTCSSDICNQGGPACNGSLATTCLADGSGYVAGGSIAGPWASSAPPPSAAAGVRWRSLRVTPCTTRTATVSP